VFVLAVKRGIVDGWIVQGHFTESYLLGVWDEGFGEQTSRVLAGDLLSG